MVRLKAVREKSGDRILPAIYSDGYVALMPGEKRVITTELRDADARGEKARIVVEGFNVASAERSTSGAASQAAGGPEPWTGTYITALPASGSIPPSPRSASVASPRWRSSAFSPTRRSWVRLH
jgi:hypothetical protein